DGVYSICAISVMFGTAVIFGTLARGARSSGTCHRVSRRGALKQPRAILEDQLDVDTGRDLHPGRVIPGGQRIGPRLHVERPLPAPVRDHLRAVAIGAGSQL